MKNLFILSFTAMSMFVSAQIDNAFKYLSKDDYTNSYKYLHEVIRIEPDNAAVNYGLAKYFSSKDNPAYNLDSAIIYINNAAKKIPFNPDDKQTKKFLTLGVRAYTIQILQRTINFEAYSIAEKQNTLESFQHYIDHYNDKTMLEQAKAQLDKIVSHSGANNTPYSQGSITSPPINSSVNNSGAQIKIRKATIEDFKDIYGKNKQYVLRKFSETPEVKEDCLNYADEGVLINFYPLNTTGTATYILIMLYFYKGEMPFGLNKKMSVPDVYKLFPQVIQKRSSNDWITCYCSLSAEPKIKGEFGDPIKVTFDSYGSISSLQMHLPTLFKTETESTNAQVEATKSENPPTALNSSSPPIISIVNNAVSFKDANGNNAIDAFEKSNLHFEIRNTGKGIGSNLKVKVSCKGSSSGLTFNSTTDIPDIKAGANYTVEIPVSANGSVANGIATFTVSVDEPHGLGSDPVDIEIPVKAFMSPLVKVVDYSLTGNAGTSLVRKQPFDLQVLIQNTQQGKADNVEATLRIPENILLLSGDLTTNIGGLNAGTTKELIYSLIVTNYYTSGSIPITIHLKEKYGKYAEDKTISLSLNQSLATNKITVTASSDNSLPVTIKEASLSSDVDKNIPSNPGSNTNTYALIIGNENYSDFQSDISSEANVDFARNDAGIFSKYCEKTLGLPADNISLITDATAGKMQQAIDKMKTLIKNSDGKLQVIFYYAGHGLPDESTHEPYLMPVDVSGKDLSRAVKIAEVYSSLTAYPSKGVTVFLDACFSGGARNKPLLAARSVKIRPKEEALKGRITVFTASSGDQTSWPYKDKQHGMFTYFLLKKLQDSKGDVNYTELGNYLNQQVKFQSVKINSKEQEPQFIYSTDITAVELAKTKLKEGFK